MVSHVLHSYFIHTNLCISVADTYNRMSTTYMIRISGENGLPSVSISFTHVLSVPVYLYSSCMPLPIFPCLSLCIHIPSGQITGDVTLEFTDLGEQGSAMSTEQAALISGCL